MRTILGFAALTLAVIFTASLQIRAASAEDRLWLPVGPNGVEIRRCDPDREYCGERRDDRRYRSVDEFSRRDHDDFRRSECTADRALRKADRMGIYRAHIVDVGRRTIDIQGRRDGRRVEVSFYRRDRSCPIAY